MKREFEMKGERIVTGKRGELKVIGKLLEEGFTVYTPIADVEGIDCIIKNDKGRLIEIQIKTMNEGDEDRHFRVKNLKPHEDFFICCYLIDTGELWTIPSYTFKKISYTLSNGTSGIVMNQSKRRELSVYKDDLGLGLLRLGRYRDSN